MFKKLKRRLVSRAVHALTRPIKIYSPSEISNIDTLRKRLVPCDLILVSGNARISHVVKVLTMSQWSHVVLYVGDRRELLNEKERLEWTELYGEECLNHLVIDADPVKKVHLRPIDAYHGLMLRHCRPEALTKKDRQSVVSEALAKLGKNYDIRHIIRLLFFFAFPWEILPETPRRFITDFALSEKDTICSRVISEAFHSVGYPIRPSSLIQKEKGGFIYKNTLNLTLALRHKTKTTLKLARAGKVKKAIDRFSGRNYSEIHLRQSRHITPADYDLSRFFSVIKDPDDLKINYKEAKISCEI